MTDIYWKFLERLINRFAEELDIEIACDLASRLHIELDQAVDLDLLAEEHATRLIAAYGRIRWIVEPHFNNPRSPSLHRMNPTILKMLRNMADHYQIIVVPPTSTPE